MKYKFRRYYIYYWARVGLFFVYLLPRSIGLFIASKLGEFGYLVLPKYRHAAIDNLTIAFGDSKSRAEIKEIARRVFANLAKNTFELVQFPKITKENFPRLVKPVGLENLDEAFALGKGTIILTAHFGNWELLAASIRMLGYPGVTIGRRIYFHKYDELLNYFRGIHDVHVIYRDDSPRKMLKVLKENKIVGVVADQDIDSLDGVYVNFFGKPAFTPVGPVGLAKLSGAAVVPAVIVRNPDDTHNLIFEKMVSFTDTGDKEKDLVANTQKWSDIIENYARKYPEQWVWIHNRWKTQPS